MEACKKILYGVSDYAELRRSNGWFIDRTDFIRDLETSGSRFAMFLRPRRFGKSLLISILQAYYDVNYAGRFDELFSGTKIGENPTEERGKYMVLYFNFSAIDKNVLKVQDSFNDYACLCIDKFARSYASVLPEGLAEKVLAVRDCNIKLNLLTVELQGSSTGIYILIDEYDNFTNTILAESGYSAYDDITHGEGFFKQFFTVLKAMMTAIDSPVKRMFITGVSPVTMDDVTSGFNIATNISTHSSFANTVGFTHNDLTEIVDYYAPVCGYDRKKVFDTIVRWYDGYRFCPDSPELVANTSMVLRYMANWISEKREIRDLVDANLRTDYAKIRHLVTVGKKLNGNFSLLEGIIQDGGKTSFLVDSFQAQDMSEEQNFVSLLFYFGMLSIKGASGPLVEFTVPNETVKGFMGAFVPSAYKEIGKVNPQIFELTQALAEFSSKGNWKPVVDILASLVEQTIKVRDKIEGEKFIQATIIAYLRSAVSAYFVEHEYESNGGYADLLLEPDLSRYPEVKHALLMELKYFNTSQKVGKAKLATIRKQAAKQLAQYATDHDLQTRLRVKSGSGERATGNGGATLHRLSVVFHGGKLGMSEEV